MPEGDTIAYAAKRLRPVLEGHVPDEIRTPQRRHAMDRWPERLGGRVITEITTHGKHLFVHFEGELTLHSHLRMTGAWGVYTPGRRPRRSMRRAWLVLRRGSTEVVEFDGPVLELLTESRARLDRRLAGLGPDVLADEFDYARFLARLRGDDPTSRGCRSRRCCAGRAAHRRSRESDHLHAAAPARSSTPRGPGCGARPTPATRRATAACSAGAASRARAVERRSAPVARATTTARPSGVRAASADRAAWAAVATAGSSRSSGRRAPRTPPCDARSWSCASPRPGGVRHGST
jgi:hypothetical protein